MQWLRCFGAALLCYRRLWNKNTPPEKKTLGKISLKNTKSRAGKEFLPLVCRAKARPKGVCFSQTPVLATFTGGFQLRVSPKHFPVQPGIMLRRVLSPARAPCLVETKPWRLQQTHSNEAQTSKNNNHECCSWCSFGRGHSNSSRCKPRPSPEPVRPLPPRYDKFNYFEETKSL